MKSGPLTQCEAIARCFEFQYLRGAPLNDQFCIEMVIVAPYGAAEQARFLEALVNEEGEINEILPLNDSRQYDVIVVGFKMSEDISLRTQPLRRYMTELAPLYGMARFRCPPPDILSQPNRYLT